MIRRLLLYCALFFYSSLSAQDFSNKGREFWIPYSYHQVMNTSNASGVTMTIYITSDVTTTYSVELFGSPSVPVSSGSVAAGQVIPVVIPNSAFINDDGLFSNRAIRVVGQKPLVVYSFITYNAVSGATLCLPTNVLGKEYYSMNYTQRANVHDANSSITILATEDGTTLEITPSANTKGGWAANTLHTINLNKGDIYQILGSVTNTGNAANPFSTGSDLTGTKIKSVAGAGGLCKKIAVFSGSGRLIIGSGGCGTTSDNLYQQLYPVAAWGKKFITVPSYNRPLNFYRVAKLSAATNVYVNGNLIPNPAFVNGFYYEFSSSTPVHIEGTEAISVAQYFTSQSCNSNAAPYDPEMIVLSPVEQNINKVTLVNAALVANQANYNHQHHLQVILPNSGTAISSFRVDGNPLPATYSWTPITQAPGYMYTYIHNISQGYHTLSSDSGFNALAYGYGEAESYGYSAGASVKDLFQFITMQNEGTNIKYPLTCKGTSFYLYQTLPYITSQIVWDFSTTGLGISNYTSNNPISLVDSIYTVGTKTLYRYKNPNLYTINQTGVFSFTVNVINPTPDGCTGLQDIDYELEVLDAPIANFSWTHTGCISDTVFFNENNSTLNGYTIKKWKWKYDDGTIDSIKSPKKLYSYGGALPVKLQIQNDVGCVSDTVIKTVSISSVPIASFNLQTATCQNKPIVLQSTATVNIGSLVKWIWQWGDGSPNDTLLSNQPLVHIYSNTGNYTISHKVISNTGCISLIKDTTIYINTNPIASFTVPVAVCLPDSTATFNNITTINDGTIGQVQYLWNFGDGSSTSITIHPTHLYSNTGPFNVLLQATSNNGCVDDTVIIFNNIFPQPIANFTGNTEVCIYDTILFTSISNPINGNIAQYFWDAGNGVFTQGSSTMRTAFNASGNKTIRHYIRTSNGCISDTMVKNIYVNQLPIAMFTQSVILCEKDSIQFTSNATSNDGTITQWNWIFGDGSPQQQVNNNTIKHLYGNANSYNVTHHVVSDKGCRSRDTIAAILVNHKPIADFDFPQNICLPMGVTTFNNVTTIADGTQNLLTYLWNFGDGTPVTNTINPIHTYNTVGPFNVRLTATSNKGCIKDTIKLLNTIRQQPQASFNSNNEICLNDSLQLLSNVNTFGAVITSYFWDFGDGTTSILPNPKKKWSSTGNKIVKHWIITNQGCASDTVNSIIYVNTKPVADFNFPNLGRCSNKQILFTSAATSQDGAVTNWYWDFGDGSPIANVTSATINHSFSTIGTFTVRHWVVSSKGCLSDTINKQITITASPLASFNLPGQLCLPQALASFTNTTTISDGTISTVTYQWNFGDGSPMSNNPSPLHLYQNTGPYSVQLTATSLIGCVDDTIQIINTINPRPSANFSIVQEACVNSTINISSTSNPGNGNIIEYFWDLGNGNFTNGASTTTISFNTSGTKNIRHYIRTNNNCISDTITKTIYINALPLANFNTITPQCIQKAILFLSGSSASDGVITSYTWNYGDGSADFNTALSTPVSHTYNALTIVPVKLKITTSKGCVGDTTKLITIHPNPIVNFGLPEICLNDPTAQFTDSSSISDGTEALFSYLWNFGDPNASLPANPNTSTIKNATHIYSATGNYNMSLEVTSNYGCKEKKDTVFTVNGVNPIADFRFLNATTICSDKIVTVENLSTVDFGNVTRLEIYWDWLNDPTNKTIDEQPFFGENYQHTYPTFGVPNNKTYTVRVVAYSGLITGTCNNAISKNITLLGSPKVVFNTIPKMCTVDSGVTLNQALETTGLTGVGVYSGNGVQNNKFYPNIAGVGIHTILYTFTANTGCVDSATQAIEVNQSPTVTAGPDRTILNGETTVLLGNSPTPNVSYLWTTSFPNTINNPTIAQPIVKPLINSTYYIKVTTDKGCTAVDSVFVKVFNKVSPANAFSPNGDGINDTWIIEHLDNYDNATIEVYNIYGELLFKGNNRSRPWDGKYKNSALPIGTYYYIIDLKNGYPAIRGYVGIIR